ncbi:hypothetical protein [Bosea minatitlanensis]|jgi:uncharacterized protein YlxW (UPF0749 family)|uniref:Uncharacterized protein n=1 Tax=Bosea minatitlanensis TaxID=128782 RepID=A0ABW0F439_9HYPH|nr:hypothetical protein [Bosea minatitlanensis]MCT4493950.1 hypothetical protein [Bosea minatitlanensis]
MSNHAFNLEMGSAVIGSSLANAIVQNNIRRRDERIAAEAEANSVASVRRLAAALATAQNEVAASRRREAAMQEEINRLRFDLGRAHAAIRRLV